MAVEWDRVAKMADARAPRPLVTACAVLAVLSGLLVGVTALRTPVGAATSATDGGTRGADNYRTGWYPDQTELSPSLVGGGTFGQLFDTPVDGEVYGQPLVDDGQLLVNTENNYAYGLDPVTGAILWTREFGAPVLATNIGCADLTPTFGVTSTPVVDQSTDVEYLVDNEYVSGDSGPTAYYMHALNLADNGTEEPGFPVEIQGTASNDPSLTFNPSQELQRPGLLLMNGTVYAAFAAHCDIKPWEGWIAGVTETGTLQTMWTTAATSTDASPDSGAGIWMSGGGLVSDGPGQILFATGNGASNGAGPIPGNTPPPDLGEAVVRVAVQPDGSLKAVDFFSPYDATTLDQSDLDFGSGSPVALPDAYFGTAAIPHLAVAVGKEGYVYLLNRDNLGGVGEGPNGTDDVVGRYGPNGGVWSSPAVWPGDGGYIYIPTASGSVSSSGSDRGDGCVPVRRERFGHAHAQPGRPVRGRLRVRLERTGGHVRRHYPRLGTRVDCVVGRRVGSRGAAPGVRPGPGGRGPPAGVERAGRHVLQVQPAGCGRQPPLRRHPRRTRPRVRRSGGCSRHRHRRPPSRRPWSGRPPPRPRPSPPMSAVTITSLSATGPFTLGTPSQTLPAALGQGASISVPVTFAPTAPGPVGGGLTVTLATSQTITVDLTASGQVDGPSLSSTTNGISFGGIPPDAQASTTVGFVDNGSQPLTISAVDLPAAPFTVSGVPTLGAQLEPGAEVVVNVTFAPSLEGSYASTLELDSTGGNLTVALTGNSTSPAVLSITPTSLDYGSVPVGTTSAESFTVSNTGSANLTITKSKPPATGPFTASTELSEGTTLVPGESVTETVVFTPTVAGAVSDTWIITGDDGSGPRTISFSGHWVHPRTRHQGIDGFFARILARGLRRRDLQFRLGAVPWLDRQPRVAEARGRNRPDCG